MTNRTLRPISEQRTFLQHKLRLQRIANKHKQSNNSPTRPLAVREFRAPQPKTLPIQIQLISTVAQHARADCIGTPPNDHNTIYTYAVTYHSAQSNTRIPQPAKNISRGQHANALASAIFVGFEACWLVPTQFEGILINTSPRLATAYRREFRFC